LPKHCIYVSNVILRTNSSNWPVILM